MQEIEELILHYLGEDWHRVGQLLRMSPKVMKEIGSKFGSFPTQCSEAMFSKWLNHEKGTGHKERTWGTVLTALEDAGRGDVAISVLDKLTAKHKEGLCMNTTRAFYHSCIVDIWVHTECPTEPVERKFYDFPITTKLTVCDVT